MTRAGSCSHRPMRSGGTSHHRLGRSLLVGLVLAVFQVGCNFEGSGGQSASVNTCKTDADCSSGSACEAGMCVATESPSLEIGLEVHLKRAASDGNPLTTTVAPFEVDGPTHRDIRLPATVEVAGDARYRGQRIAADIRFTRQVGIDGLAPRSLRVQTLAEPTTDSEGHEASYLTRLFADVAYRMRVVPTGDHASRLPPLERTVRAEPDAVSHRVDIDYDEVLSDAETLQIALSGVPEERKLQVRAVDAASGRVVSSSHVVDSSAATLSVRLMPFDGERLVQILPAPPEVEPSMSPEQAPRPSPYPTFTVPLASLETEEDGMRRIELPTVPEPVTFRGVVDLCPDWGPELDEDLGLPVTFRTSSPDLDMPLDMQASFTATTTTGTAAGESADVFEVSVLPGDYEVVIAPPTDSPCSIYAEAGRSIQAGETLIQGELFTLEDAAQLSGTVFREDQSQAGRQPMSGVRVQAITLARAELDQVQTVLARYNRSAQATTGMDGTFSLPLDVGSYDMVIKPPPESGFGWQLLHDVGIGTKQKRLPPSSIRLDAPVPLTGTLLSGALDEGETSMRLAGAEITAYVVLSDRKNESPRAVAVGATVADEEGDFTLLLSPSLRAGLY